MAVPLTKADTVALWHAVDALRWQVNAMRSSKGSFTPEQIEADRTRLAAANKELRIVNAIRRGQGRALTGAARPAALPAAAAASVPRRAGPIRSR